MPVDRRDVLWNGPVRLSVRQSVTIACERDILKPLVGLTSHFDMALILLRPRTLLILGILQKTRWPPQQFED